MTTVLDFDNLPPSVDTVPAPEPHTAPDSEPTDTGAPICLTCNRAIIREPGKRGRIPKYHPECRPSAKSKPTGTRRKAKGTPDYREGISGLLQMAAFGLAMAAGDHNVALLADGHAIAEATPEIASAVDALAQENPQIAAVLDKILAVGPYGILLAVMSKPLTQIASKDRKSVV